MEIGNQIKVLRMMRGVTQETLAKALHVLPQTVSKWETSTCLPDIQQLPAISAYFGVSIDALFALTDETRMERIQNLLDNNREVEPAVLDREAAFLLEKARREPKNTAVWTLLACLENHRADAAKRKAYEYARQALSGEGAHGDALWEMARSAGLMGPYWELADSHLRLIEELQAYLRAHPQSASGYEWLIQALLLDGRFQEAEQTCNAYAKVDTPLYVSHYRGLIAWKGGDREKALEIWKGMLRDNPEDLETMGLYAEDYALTGDYAGAADLYRRIQSRMEPPRSAWAWEMGAYSCELAGDYPGAIAALEELLQVRKEDYGYCEDAGEQAYRADIARLKEKQSGPQRR